jgi:hypothetical protein
MNWFIRRDDKKECEVFRRFLALIARRLPL